LLRQFVEIMVMIVITL